MDSTLSPHPVPATRPPRSVGRRLCLNMIVKNESRIIRRCLESVADHIACWVIGDTGSTDDTPQLIEEFFTARGIPGELHHFPFENFGQARNDALARARASSLDYDYLLLTDADMELKVVDPTFRNRLIASGYAIEQRNGHRYWNMRLLRRDITAIYRGVTHEHIHVGGDSTQLSDVWYHDHANGANRVEKAERDTRLLTEDLVRDPDNPRTYFYLGQTHKFAGRLVEAAQCYGRRVELGGWAEEAWYALWQQATCLLQLEDFAGFERLCLAAYDRRPHRAEPLMSLARYHREQGRNEAALLFAEAGLALPWPRQDVLFIDAWTYRTGLLEEYALCAHHSANPARRDRGRRLCDRLALGRDVPARARNHARRTIRNYAVWAADILPSFTCSPVVFAVPEGLLARAATLAVVGGQMFMLQVSGASPGGHQTLVPQLHLHAIDEQGRVRASREIAIPHAFPTRAGDRWDIASLGLLAWGDALWCIASQRDAAAQWDGAVLARVDVASSPASLTDWRVLTRTVLPRIGQDWTPLATGEVPTFLCAIDPTWRVDLTHRAVWEAQPDCHADHFHPAAPAVPFDSGWLTILRETIPAGERGGPLMRYAWFDPGFVLGALSRPFRFDWHIPGAMLGLAYSPVEDRLLASHTTESGSVCLTGTTAQDIRSLLIPARDILFDLPGEA